MAALFRSGRVNNQNPVATGLRVSSPMEGTPIPIGCGLTRWAPILIDYNGFSATPAKSPGGKGGVVGSSGKGNTGQYNYAASGIMLLGEGIVARVNTIFNGNYIDFLVAPSTQWLDDLANIGIDASQITIGVDAYSSTLHTGTYSQSADSFWTAQFPASALAYRGLATLVIPNLQLGSSPSWPSLNVEALWSINTDIPALGSDANPADWIAAFLTNPDWGVQGFPSSALGDFSTARNYWRATGMLISLALTGATAANSHLKSLMDALNADFRWSGGVLDIVPYGDVAVTANGYTYTPNVTPIYSLGPDDFLPNQGGMGSAGSSFVGFSRIAVSEVFNKLQVEYLDRSNLYNPVKIEATDEASIVVQGRLRLSDLKQNHFFNLASAASMSAQLQLQWLLAGVNSYQITIGPQFALLDPLDLIAISEPALGLISQLCRITEIKENSDRTLTLSLEEVPLTAAAPLYNRQASLGQARNANAPPGSVNAPIFFEPPDALSKGLALLIGLSGSTPNNYGGAAVWISSDNANFEPLGTLAGATRMGVLTAPLASVAAAVSGVTVDSTHTLAVNLAESLGSLVSVSPTAFASLATICAVDNEIIAFQTATLTGANAYNLTILARGLYGSTIAAHAAGAPIMRLDGGAFEWDFPSSYIGQTVYFKFLAYNAFGVAEQSLSNVGAYSYIVQGSALASALPNVANVYSRFTGGFQDIWWDEVSDFRPVSYEIRQGATWAGGLVIATQFHPPFHARGTGTFWIAAKSTPAAGILVYSAAPTSYTIAGNQLAQNMVFSYDEQAAGWPGLPQTGLGIDGLGANRYLRLGSSKNVLGDANVLTETDILNAGGLTAGTAFYYTSAQVVDLSYPAQVSLNASATFAGVPVGQNIHSLANILATLDVLGSVSTQYIQGWIEVRLGFAASPNDVFAPSDAFTAYDAFTMIAWSSWQKFVPGVQQGRFVQFRLALLTNDPLSIPYALSFNYQAQVAARIDHYQNLSVPSAGYAIVFQPDGASAPGPFNGGPKAGNLPAVNVDWGVQTAVDYAITAFTNAGLTIQFFNSVGAPVAATGVQVQVQGY